MALCCIGGVCVPYSALVPILLLAVKWIVEKLVNAGLLPKSLEDRLARAISQHPRSSPPPSPTVVSCCSSSSSSNSDALVKEIKSEKEWLNLMNSTTTVIVKWSARWCQPCKAIQPAFEALAAKYELPDVTFVTADADTLENISCKFGIAMLPTFCVHHKSKVVDRYSGSNEGKLTSLVDSAMAKVMAK